MEKFDWRYVTLFVLILVWSVNGGIEGVIKVNYKFSGSERNLRALKAHDEMRHLRILAGIDLPIGGIGRPDSVGLYYAKIGIGTPPTNYYVQVDTGSDIMWVNCITCQECPRRGYHGLELTLYNPRDSLTGKLIVCGHSFCKDIDRGSVSGCYGNTSCTYGQVYGDGSYSRGYFVEDVVQYDQVSGDLQTKSSNGSVIFGCGASQSGDLNSSDEALDGVLGFGKSNSSMLSQLASSGRVTKKFAHCLDGVNGGGIFAIGDVVQPKVNMTPLVPNQPHYNVNMKAVEVGYQFLNLSVDVRMNGEDNGVIIDSGTTLAYLPEVIYGPLVKKIFSWQPDLKLRTIRDEYTCFEYSGSVNDGFPQVTFHFENSLSLRVRPREYLFPYEDLFCIGWQNSGTQSRDKWNLTLFGDLVLSNKLVLYDLENQAIGWTDYNCSSSIELKDEITGSVRLVGAHSLSSGSSLTAQTALTIFFLLVVLLHNYLFNW
ncbi:aspartic proteinase 36-like [Nicotiana tabacum]|uniref:Aspartic proteinase 36-like n=3 Tax=Nicotiana tabacum TaxID=4097 RepID=A0AC58SFM7_TOBAC|nr:aspartic proteinase-like protein 2 isoform X1 [Nicotiana tomentosiformis]XP_009626123.1 aspartic proteinase-like protein 2 isoform X1 [Nicotiana tomentosiformis]XP_009626124.1 aspartic proteinase-like protein 2 isoform X1 [Nicotiana tomentosiformis]